jgi:hypothetical protein
LRRKEMTSNSENIENINSLIIGIGLIRFSTL